MRARTVWVVVLVLTVALTFAVTVQTIVTTEPPPSVNLITLADGTRLAYERSGSGDRAMVLLHGSPGGRGDFTGLKRFFGDEFTLYAFDMPGFGDSSMRVPNYGFAAAADYLAEAVDALGIAPITVTGFSWGGGPAIEFAARYPELTDSLILIAAVGVTEGFHTGSRILEYARSVLAAPTLLVYPGSVAPGLIPLAERHGFWRSFLDSNTNRIARIAPDVAAPAIIVHGRSDTVTGPAGARRLAELMPAGRLVWYDGGHGWIYRRYDELAAVVRTALGMEAMPR